MEFLIGLLNFIVFIFYIVAGIAAFGTLIGFMSNDGKDGGSIKFGLIAAVAGVVFGCGGYFIRDYADSLKRSKNFTESFTNGDKEKIKWRFHGLSEEDKNEYIGEIFDKFYGHDFNGEYEFLSDYGDENIAFVQDVKDQLDDRIKALYNKAESINTKESWLSFSGKVAGKFFLKYANDNLKELEFAKWGNEDAAWQRVLVMDSLAMSHEYLSRFPHGIHECNARKIILDHSYSDYTRNKPPFKITQNYCGTTTISVRSSANADLNIHYSATFATGNFKVPGYGYNSVTVPNGYYSISVSSYQTRARGETTLETLDGGVKSFDYHITIDGGRRR